MTSSPGHLHEDLDKKICLECNRKYTGLVLACSHDGSALVPIAKDPLIGTKLIGKYDILSVLGTGGMGVVYKGRQDVMDRIVAIKMLQAHHLSDSMSVKRFQQEGKATCRLNHPHIITVYDFGISKSGQPYIVMDYLEGKPLSDIIREEGQVSVERSVNIIRQAAEALGHAHKQGVLHRDLKPSNIVLTEYEGEKDYVKVVDFGVAKLLEDGNSEGQKLTQMGEVCGSPVYMSPEQCQGLPLDKRSDIYSMGILLYETLTNRLPLLGKTMVETMSKHIEGKPSPFSEVRPDLYIPERLEQVVLRALEKKPEKRQQSMEQLATELDMAIPKPGRSQVLRTTDLRASDELEEEEEENVWYKNISMTHWAIALVVACVIGVFALITLFSYFSQDTMDATKEKPVQKTAAPANKTTEPKENKSGTSKSEKVESPKEVKEEPKVEKPEAAAPVEPKPKPKPKPKPRKVVKPRSKPAPRKKPKKAPKGGSLFDDLKNSRSY